jgi:signal transduction histidine kinase
LALINDILDLAKVEAGKAELHEETVDVSRVFQTCITLVRERAKDADVKIESDAPANLPALFADERKLKQILINLLSNAIKFTLPGGKVSARAWYREHDGYVLQVADTGIGIAPEDIPRALRPFQQVDSDLNRKYQGTGLGLPLTKALAELHGGSLDLQSEVGVGTTVTVRVSSRAHWQRSGPSQLGPDHCTQLDLLGCPCHEIENDDAMGIDQPLQGTVLLHMVMR